MFALGYDPELYVATRRKELIQEAQEQRLVREALKSRQGQPGTTAKILRLVGRRLSELGASLEERYDSQQQAASS